MMNPGPYTLDGCAVLMGLGLWLRGTELSVTQTNMLGFVVFRVWGNLKRGLKDFCPVYYKGALWGFRLAWGRSVPGLPREAGALND